MSYYFITLIVFQSYSSFCVSMTFSKEEAVKGLKEVTKMLEEGYKVDSSALCLIEEFLKKFPLSPKSRNMWTFPPELLQPVYACIESLYQLKSLILYWCVLYQYISTFIINDSMEFQILRLSQGDGSVRDFRGLVRRIISDGTADFFITIFS